MARYKNSKQWEEKGGKRVNPKYAKEYNTEFVQIAEKLIATGATERDVAFLLGTSLSGLKDWKRTYPEFKKAINNGRELTLTYLTSKGLAQSVDRKIKDRTTEYTAKIDKDGNIIDILGDEEGEKIAKVREIEKEVPGDNRLLMFLISSLERSLGRDTFINRQFIDKKVEETITHRVDSDSVREQIEKLSGSLSKRVENRELGLLESDNEN